MIKKLLQHIFVFLFAVFLIVYFYIQVKNIFVESMETEHATVITIQDNIELKCYIIRDETVVDSQVGGTYNYVISEGEKLSSGQTIANVYSTDSEYRVREQIQSIDNRIAVLEDSSVENNYFTMNVTKIDEGISETLTSFRKDVASGNLSLALQRKEDLLVSFNKRYLIVNSLTGFDEMIEVLNNKKNSLTSGSSSKVESVLAPVSGYFFSDVDGFEGVLTSEIVNNITVGEFLEIVKNTPERVSSSSVGKIVSGFEWYSVCIADNKQAQKFNTGEYYNVSYPYSTGMTVLSKLISKVTQPDVETTLLIFTSDRNLSGFNFMREQIAEVNLNSYTGLKIKKEALRIVDGFEGVYILDGNTVQFKRANKIYENDGYYVVSTADPDSENNVPYLEMYDAVINNGKELYDGKVVG